MQKAGLSFANKLAELAGLQTPAARLAAFGVITAAIYVLPYERLESAPEVSIWARLKVPAWSIGLTRAYSKLLHRDIRGAYAQNPLIFPVVGVVAAISVADLRSIIESRRRQVGQPALSEADPSNHDFASRLTISSTTSEVE